MLYNLLKSICIYFDRYLIICPLIFLVYIYIYIYYTFSQKRRRYFVIVHYNILKIFFSLQAAFLAIKSTGGKLLVFQSGKLIIFYTTNFVLLSCYNTIFVTLQFMFHISYAVDYAVPPFCSFLLKDVYIRLHIQKRKKKGNTASSLIHVSVIL